MSISMPFSIILERNLTLDLLLLNGVINALIYGKDLIDEDSDARKIARKDGWMV